MSSTLSIDFETRSVVDLRRTGVYPYAEHSTTGLWCMAWAFDNDDVSLWREGEPLPKDIVDYVNSGGEMRAWNAQFERVMWNIVGVRKYGFPLTRIKQYVDTAAEAAAMALPRHLAEASFVLGVTQQKDAEGQRLMLQMCRPRSYKEDGTPVWWNVDEKLVRLGDYCKQDVRTERAVAKVIRRLGARELQIYHLDQLINDRGVGLDVALATAAKEVAEQETLRQNAIITEATNGVVDSVTRVQALRKWCAERGVVTPSLDKDHMRDLLAREQLPDDVAAALLARSEAAKSSVAKIDTMFDCLAADGRMHGLMLYHGAHTGRWSGRLVQPQNFPRPDLDDAEIEAAIPAVIRREPHSLNVIASLLRSMITPHEGYELVACDFAAIEARVVAWVSGEADLVAAFRQGRKIYHEMGARIFERPAETIIKPSEDYRISKDTVLGCGFGMGWETFKRQAKEKAGVIVSEELAQKCVETFRTTYPRIKRFWTTINDAALDAVAKPGDVFPAGPVKFTKRGGYLWCILPSGRPLAYAAPRIVDRETPWKEMLPAVEFSGMNSYTRKWQRMGLYGGLLTENVVQAIARDLMAEAMLRVEAEGYPVVLTVHDEIVSEVPVGTGDVAHYEGLMSAVPAWAAGCPVAAEGWRGLRYRK